MSGARYHQAPYSDNYGGNFSPSPQPYSDGQGYNDSTAGLRDNEYPMNSGNPYAATASHPQRAPKKRKWLWWIVGAIVLICVIVGAVLGGVLGSRAKNNNGKGSSSGGNAAATGAPGKDGNTAFATGTKGADGGNSALPTMLSYWATNMAVQTQSGVNGQVYLAVATDTNMLPAYVTGTNTAGYSEPTKDAQPGQNGAWPSDDSSPSSSSPRAHPRIIAPKYKWDALNNGLINGDPYLTHWHKIIIENATATLNEPPTAYVEDGGLSGSGVLDVAREVKVKIKNLAYAYRTTGETKYVDRAWLELRTASGNNPDVAFGNGTTAWNGAGHFLDLAEFTSAFAIGYDWLFDVWTAEQKSTIRTAIFNMGLTYGANALTGTNGGGAYNWWTGVTPGKNTQVIDGNWNCVNNAGLILGALAVMDEDQNGMAAQILELAVPGAQANCFQGAYSDGTWAETPNYWYFGTTGAAEMVSALQTALGGTNGVSLATSNPGFNLTSLAHMYVTGMTAKFEYGDHGPNKYSATANSLLLWSQIFNEPRYALYQRDQYDASEPFSMFWYDPTVEGTWWANLPIDRHFDDKKGEWATARSSWSDNSGTYWAMKAGTLLNHQTHGDLDLGDFVIDAMGYRWAGELGSDQYLGTGYFSSEAQDSPRWNYYRKQTEGQNTILIGNANQLVTAPAPGTNWGSSGTAQGVAPYLALDTTDTAFFTMDMSAAYGTGASVKRGIRFLNGRKQILVQDEVTGPSGSGIMWRMQTNATVEAQGASATLTSHDGKVCKVDIVNGEGTFTTMQPTHLTGTAPADEMPNPGLTVLVINNAAGGSLNVDVLFTPQWPGESNFVTPTHVALDSWSLSSH
ncbi:hypothetical protein CspHIS471_0600550 [Cutaneotrichosporon sp. HIS471]|nr:hypothetical protein CspHIS471_0600550 [Cutaneotrichosporon sp. HIS471]